MNPSEAAAVNQKQLSDLRKLISRGEGLQLEFKRKAAYPDKIAREVIAFANTNGGTLLIGVDDDGSIPGVKFPEEESLAIHHSLQSYCRPSISLTELIVPVSKTRFVLRFDIQTTPSRPHYLKVNGTVKESFVRAHDMSVKAS